MKKQMITDGFRVVLTLIILIYSVLAETVKVCNVKETVRLGISTTMFFYFFFIFFLFINSYHIHITRHKLKIYKNRNNT